MIQIAKIAFAALVSSVSSLEYAQVHDYIQDENCKATYISKHRPACVHEDGTCHAPGTENGCRDVQTWQWTNHNDPLRSYAPGVLPPPHQRMTHNGGDKRKLIWAYTGDIRQALAYEIYGHDHQVTPEALINTPTNQISFIANVQINSTSPEWFAPGKNDTDGCGQVQTWQLPFGYDGHNATEKTQAGFIKNLTMIKEHGITITMTMGSWCTSFPLEEWSEDQFTGFVDYFKHVRETAFGGHLDGIDWDWEGFCSQVCLKGNCKCDWDDKICGDKSPEELKAGVFFDREFDTPGHPKIRYQCYILPTRETVQVMTGITHHMKEAGFIVTLAPMSTAVYTSEPDNSPKQVMRNEFVKWREHRVGGDTRDLLHMVDAMLLQWYSGFDATICTNHPDGPKVCACDNIELEDYPNIYNNTQDPHKAGVFYNYFDMDDFGGNMYPQWWPTRCQACGKDVIMPNGTVMDFPCYRPGDDWFLPGNVTKYPEIWHDHNEKMKNYTETYTVDGKPGHAYWWPRNMTVTGKCPRSLDCPDWRYHNEKPYARQVKLLKSLSKIVDVSKISVGFETLGVDVLVQQMSYSDHALYWSTATNEEKWNKEIYFHECKKNVTLSEPLGSHRCGAPLLQQQWGLKFNATEMIGLTDALKEEIGAELAGIGVFTLDGMMWQESKEKERFWYRELCKLNKHYKVPCSGPCCTEEHFNSPEEEHTPNAIYYSIHPDAAGGVDDKSGEKADQVEWFEDIVQKDEFIQ